MNPEKFTSAMEISGPEGYSSRAPGADGQGASDWIWWAWTDCRLAMSQAMLKTAI